MRLAGTGSARPSDVGLGADGPRALENEDVWQLLFGDSWELELERRGWDAQHPWTAWGVRRREWVHRPGDAPEVERATEQLAMRAARRALADAGVEAAELDLVVAATSTPDRIGASLSGRLAARLGTDAGCLDARAGGAGGVEAWIAAARFLAGGARRALVVASEVTSGYLDPGDAAAAALFGDGAAAQVLAADAGSSGGLLGACGASDASPARSFTIPGGLPPTELDFDAGRYRLRAPDGAYVERLAANWSSLGEELRRLARGSRAAHVLGVATRSQVRASGLEGEVHTSLEEHGATGAAAVGIALDELLRSGGVQAGTLLVGAVGGGIHRAGLAWRLDGPSKAGGVVDS